MSTVLGVVIVDDFGKPRSELARMASINEAREWFKKNPEYVPVHRSYICEQSTYKVSAVCRYGPFSNKEIVL